MDKNLVQAFQRLEKKVADEKARARREEREREAADLRARQLRRQQFVERLTLGLTIAFSVFVAVAVWYTDGAFIKDAAVAIKSIADTANSAPTTFDCNAKQYRHSRACMADRDAETEASWDGISLYSKGKENPFALHKRE
ncbi:MAG: hypothetical protein KDD69_14860 [Bdellovibrionales bacterium]|nr:hypothetical protein [Bdellovibrionales bacterium]